MATLNNTRISDTYHGLIKTLDNTAISATLKQLSDGDGTATGLSINNAGDFKVNAILEFGSLKDTGENIIISKFVDAADGIGNNDNDTSIPTSAAVVSYVASVITAEDLDFTGDDAAVSGDVDLNSEKFRILGTANEIETSVVSAGGNQLRIGIPTNPVLTGIVTATTFSGDLNGTINTATTAVTQSAGDSSTKVATTKFVMDLDAGSDLDFSGDSGTGDVTLNTQTFAITGTTNQVTTSASNETLNISLPSTVHRNLEGNVVGNLTGNVTGNVAGDLTGNVTATSVLADGVTATTQASSDSSTKVATTAYVKSLDNASDLDFSGNTGTGDVTLNSQSLAVTGIANEIVTTAANQGLTVGFPTTGITLPNGSVATTQASSDDSTKIATTAFVKGLDSASDLDITDGTTAGDVNLNTQSLSILGTASQVVSTVLNQGVTLSLPSSINVNSASATILQNARDISLTGEASATISSFNGSADVSGAVTLDNDSVIGKVLTGLSSPTATNILASDSILQAFGKTQSQLNTLAGGLRFMGTWNATTNTPTLASGGGEAASGTTTATTANKLVDSSATFTSTVTTGDQVVNQESGATALVTNIDSNSTLTIDADIMVSGQTYTIDNSPFLQQGHYFVVSVGGTSSLNGLSNWAVGDWVIAGSTNVWEKLDHTQVDGTGTVGNITKWSSTNVIADSIMAETGSGASALVTASGSIAATQLLSSGGNFAVNTDKFTANATTGNIVVAGTGTFAGEVKIDSSENTLLRLISTDANVFLELKDSDSTNGNFIGTIGNTMPIYTNNTLALTLDASQNATFAGSITSGAGNNFDPIIREGRVVATPAYSFVGDLDTGMFNPNLSNTIAFGTGGVERLRIDSSGNSTFAGDITAVKGFFNSGGTNVVATFTSTDAQSSIKFVDSAGNAEIGCNGNVLTFQPAGGVSQLSVGASSSTFGGSVLLGDNKELIFGVAADFKIFHNNTTNVNHILSQIDRQLTIGANIINLSNQASTTNYLTLNSTSATFANDVRIPTGKELIIGTQPTAGSPLGITIRDDQGNVPVGIQIHNEDTGTLADAAIAFETQGQMDFSLGIDRSDSGKFVMSRAGVLGTNNVFTIDNVEATFAGKIASVKELVNIKSANGLRSAGLESDSVGNIWLGTGTTAATINFVTGNSTNGLPSTNGVKRLTTNREGTDVYASYASNTFPFRVGFLNGSTYTPTFVVNDNGNVGIGTDSPSSYYSDDLVVKVPDEGGITIANNPNQLGYLMFADGTTGSEQYRGQVAYDHDGDIMSFATSGTGRMAITGAGNLVIGAAITADAKVDILGLDLNIGADNGAPTTRTNSTVKVGVITSPHYTTAEENFTGMLFVGNTTVNEVAIGGGTSTFNSATQIKFYTGANSTTVLGTEKMRITSGGKVILGTDSSNALEINSTGDTEIGFSYQAQGNVYAKIIGDITQASPLGGEMAFQTATGGTLTERMRITSEGCIYNVNANSSTFFGLDTGNIANQTGGQNTGFGHKALEDMTSGAQNTGLGAFALENNTSGSRNTAVGYAALFNGSQGGTDNTAVGVLALKNATSGSNNIGIGRDTGENITTGAKNTFVGTISGNTVVSGFENIGLGYNALKAVATGSGGIAIGISAGNFTSGNGNIAMGYAAMGTGTVTGSRNISIGDATGLNISSGGNNILIGTNAGRTGSQTPQSLGSVTTNSNEIQMGNNSHAGAFIKIAWTVTSDKRDKTNFKEIPLGLDFVSKLKPTSFEFKKERESNEADGIERYGFLAQDVLELEGENPVIINNKNSDSLKYTSDHLVPVLVKAIQELTAKVEKLEQQCNCK